MGLKRRQKRLRYVSKRLAGLGSHFRLQADGIVVPWGKVQIPVEHLERSEDEWDAGRSGNQFCRPVENATFVVPERLNKNIMRLDGV